MGYEDNYFKIYRVDFNEENPSLEEIYFEKHILGDLDVLFKEDYIYVINRSRVNIIKIN